MASFPLVRPHFAWRLRTRSLALGERTLVMGILNLTPDSFSDGGQFQTIQSAVDHGLLLLDQGADLLDLGGESTRPTARPISPDEEIERVMPALQAILIARPEAILSIDTYHAATARAAIEAGAEIVNDVSGLLWDESMAPTIAALQCGYILTHTRGTPQQWPAQSPLPAADLLPTILKDLRTQILKAKAAGVEPSHIVLDPGFGFGKRGDENFALHAGVPYLKQLGYPLLAGTSRKGFLGPSLHATTASNTASILAGAHILRVHEIPPAREAANIADSILRAAANLP